YVVPNTDITTQWNVIGGSGTHESAIDEYSSLGTSDVITTMWTNDLRDEFRMSTRTLASSAYVYKVEVFLTATDPAAPANHPCAVPRISWNNGGSWSSYDTTKEAKTSVGSGYYDWRFDFTGLNKGQTDLDNFAVGIKSYQTSPPPTVKTPSVCRVYAKVYWKRETYDLQADINLQANINSDETLTQLDLLHSYINPSNVKLQIKNEGTGQYVDFITTTYSSYAERTKNINIGTYVHSNNWVYFRFVASNVYSTFDLNINEFKLKAQWIKSSGDLDADISKTKSYSFLDRYDNGFSSYKKLYDVTISFDYRYVVDKSGYTEIAKFYFDTTSVDLTKDGSWHSFSQTFEFDSASASSFLAKFETRNGDLSFTDMDYNITFKCLDNSDHVVLQQLFEVGYPNEGSLTQLEKDEGNWNIKTTFNFVTISDGITYYNTYGRTNKLEIIFNIKVDGTWDDAAYIYSRNTSYSGTISFNVTDYMNTNNLDIFEDFEVEYIFTGNETSLTVSNLSLLDHTIYNPASLDVAITIHLDGVTSEDSFDSLDLLYAYKTDYNQLVKLFIWNNVSQSWVLIDDTVYNSFSGQNYLVNPIYVDSNFDIKLNLTGFNNTDGFSFYLDQFRVDYSWTRTQGAINADITRTINDSFLNRYDTGFDNYKKLYNITIKFDYQFTNYTTYPDLAKFYYETAGSNLIKDGSWHTFSNTYQFDSSTANDFDIKFEISNGELELNNMEYNFTFLCLNNSDNTVLQQDFELYFNQEDDLRIFRNYLELDFLIYSSFNFTPSQDGLVYHNTYGRTNKLEIIYKILANNVWHSSIYST
ncbi:MAG: hypothetical protein ACXAC2_19060, partial [Candidatus Kariarchaeaceae archaeon]